MLIIIEGIDGVGKTTLSEKIGKKLKNSFCIKILDKPKDKSLKEVEKIKKHYEFIYNLVNNNEDKIFILDRFYPSEIVYSYKRGYDAFNDKWFIDFENKIIGIPHLLIYIKKDKDFIENVFINRGEEYINKNDIDIILERYKRFLNKTKLNKIIFKNNNIKEVLKWLI